MQSSNPFFKNKLFRSETLSYDEASMTVAGTLNKALLMLVVLVGSAAFTWTMIIQGLNVFGFIIGGAIVGFIAVLISSFKPQYSPVLAPAYAVCEGLFIGGLSAIFEMRYPGMVIQAVGATFMTFMVCAWLYRAKIVQVSQRFRSILIAATLAIFSYYLVTFILTFVFPNFTPIHYGNSLMSIGISLFVIVIAAMNLFLDFDQIERGAEARLPKYMEWFGAMGLMVTLVWLYIEFLRLLAKLNSRN